MVKSRGACAGVHRVPSLRVVMLLLVPVAVCCLGIVTASFGSSSRSDSHKTASNIEPLKVHSDLNTLIVQEIQTYCQSDQSASSSNVTNIPAKDLFTQLPCSKNFVIDLFAHCNRPISQVVQTAINGLDSKECQGYDFKYAPAILFTLIEQYRPQVQTSSSSSVDTEFSTIQDWFCHMLQYYYKQEHRELPNFLHSLYAQATSNDWYTDDVNSNQKYILNQLLESKCPDVSTLKSQSVNDFIVRNRPESNVTKQLAAYGVYPASNAEHPYYSPMHKLLYLSKLESESAKTSIAALTSDVEIASLFESGHDGVLTVADYVFLQGPEFIKALHSFTLKDKFLNNATLGLGATIMNDDTSNTLADILVSVVFNSKTLVQGKNIPSTLAPHTKFLVGANNAKNHFEVIDSNNLKSLNRALAKCVGLQLLVSAENLNLDYIQRNIICKCLFDPDTNKFDSTYVMHGAILLQDQCISNFEPQLRSLSIDRSNLESWTNFGMCLVEKQRRSAVSHRGSTIIQFFRSNYMVPNCSPDSAIISDNDDIVKSLITKLNMHSDNLLKTIVFPPASPRLQARFEQAHLLPTPNRFPTVGNVELAKYYSSPFTDKPSSSSYWRIASIVIVVVLLVAILGGVAFFVYRKRMAAAAADEERPPRPRPVRPAAAGPSDEAKPASGAGRLGGRAPPRRGRRAPIPTAMEEPAEETPAESSEDQSAGNPENDSTKH